RSGHGGHPWHRRSSAHDRQSRRHARASTRRRSASAHGGIRRIALAGRNSAILAPISLPTPPAREPPAAMNRIADAGSSDSGPLSNLRSPYFSPEHEMLRAQVRRFVESEIKPK